MAANQVRYFTINYYFCELHDGLVILYGGLSDAFHFYFEELKTKFRNKSRHEKSQDVEQSPRVGGATKKGEFNKLQRNKNLLSSPSSSIKFANGKKFDLQEVRGEDDLPATLHYSFVLLSKMLNSCILFVPAFTLNLGLGLAPSRLFVALSYLSLIPSFVGSLYLAWFIVEPSMQIFVGRMNGNLKQICFVSAAIGQIGYITYALFSCAYVFYHRRYLQHFIYHRCSIITLARSYQRHQMVYLFVAFNLFAFMAEPLFGLLALLHDIRQPIYWPSFDPTTFMLCKYLTVFGCSVAVGMLSSGTVIIPLMTCFLIVSCKRHLKNLVMKQSSWHNQRAGWTKLNHSSELLALLNPRTRKIMIDFACETLLMDWPVIIETISSSGNSFVDSLLGNCYQASHLFQAKLLSRQVGQSQNAISNFSNGNFDLEFGWLQKATSDTMSTKLNSAQTSSLLFLYKNLIKSLIELKGVIQDYDRKFGNLHQISSLLACLVVSLWVTSALSEVRHKSDGSEASAEGGSDSAPVNVEKETEFKSDKAAYTTRIFYSSMSFVLSNIFIFLKCDCLFDQITKIKSQLFKMNIDLGCTFISAQRKRILQNLIEETTTRRLITPDTIPRVKISSDLPDSNSSAIYSSSNESLASGTKSKLTKNWSNSVYRVNQWREGLPKLQYEHQVNESPVLDRIWSLYDQVDRISLRANFRFSSDTYYSKKCILLVFGRAVSLILFYIQIIDMYSTWKTSPIESPIVEREQI